MRLYRVSMDFTATQYVQFLKDQPAGKQLFSLEITEKVDDAPVVLKDVVPPKPRKPRRTKAQIEADNLLGGGPKKAEYVEGPDSGPQATPDPNQRAFPWQDKAMNNDAA